MDIKPLRRNSLRLRRHFLLVVEQVFIHLHHVVHAASRSGKAEYALVDFHVLAQNATSLDVELCGAFEQSLDELRFDRGIDGRQHLVAHIDAGDSVRDLGEFVVPARLNVALGVNLGKLGFLAHIRPDKLEAVLPEVCNRNACVVEHLMFDCSLIRDGNVVETRLGLNEASVLAGPPFSILDVQLYVDAELATTYSCDGLIVSTPVGSTAHSLSAGGPILRKDLHAFVISPISPHTLTNRPVVDSADRVFELAVPKPNEGTSLILDGRVMANLRSNDRVRIERSTATFKLLHIPDQGYYRTLREKLSWGGQLRE